MEPNFIHLRLHTEYSLSDGLTSITAIMERAKALRMPAIAITDESNLYATVKFYQAAIKAGIKPIIGVDLWVADEKKQQELTRLTLLCQTNEGYKNLLKLVTKSYLVGQTYGGPHIEKTWLDDQHSRGLIALSCGAEGDIGRAILSKDDESAKAHLQFWQKTFPDRFYIEISRTGKQEEQMYIEAAVKLAHAFNVPLVATNDVRFLSHDDFEAHEARVCIKDGITLNDPNRRRLYRDQQYFRSQSEMQQLFADVPSALKNSVEIAKRCNVTFVLGESRLPHFPVPNTYTSESYLTEIAEKGLASRLQTLFANKPMEEANARTLYYERLFRELEVINNMGFAGYFLIVADFTKWAKENGIPVGPGRGSGPGSLVAYALNITDLDPLVHGLLFERFLNPERVSMPDFDIDFCIEGRDRVIEYVIQKHGQESVSQIITYGTMAAKAVVRDVGRVLGLGYGFVDKIAKLIPFELGMTLEKALDQEPLLRERYGQEEEVRTLIDLALKLEGVTRNVGKHAGGIVIAPGKLTDFVPLYCEPNDSAHPVTQFDKDDVEAVGLVKFDFLGLKTLTIIDKALQVINENLKNKGEQIIDISLIQLDDVDTFNTLKTSQSTAIFQLESHGMRDLIKRLQPDCFDDLMALIALFRPGPLQSGMVEDFINRKHGRAKVIYPHPALEPILRPTYGVIVYQDQVMQIAQVLAGYTLGAADILRRAMGKKKPEEMAKQREIFCKGANEKQQVGAELANHIFDLMEKFAGYGFNKSHSASYAKIAYQTAWLKTHYPAAFMSAVLSSDMDRTDKVIILLDECELLNLHVSPPDINKSDYYFKVIDDHHIVHGLGAIKGVGEAAIESIVASRKEKGTFTDLFDFCERVDLRKVNRRVCEALIKSGCLDCFGQHRATLLASLNNANSQAEQALQNETYGQHDLIGINNEQNAPQYVEAPPWNNEMQLQGEKETLGFYLTGHPLNQYLKELVHFTTCKIAELRPNEHQTAKLVGIITKIRTRQTKRGDRMAVFSLDDGTQQIEALCFSDNLQKYRSFLIEDQVILVEGNVNIDSFNNNTRIICRDIYTIDQARERHAKYLQINLSCMESFDLACFKQLLLAHSGNCPIILRYQRDHVKADIRLGKKWMVKPSEKLLTSIREQLAISHLNFEY
jgi:DNA polymerase-3 subunit alpha